MELIVTYKGEERALQVDDDAIIVFPNGLIGFMEWRRFVLLEDPEESPVAVLQSIDDANVSFLVTDPWCVAPDYKLELSAEDIKEINLERVEDAKVLCTLAAREGRVLVTANLLGPIVINPKARLARQVILQDSQYSAQHPVLTVDGKERSGS